MMRIVFALLAGGACALLGFEEARRLKERVESLRQWLAALEMLDLKLQHEGVPLYEAVLLDGEGAAAKRLRDFSKALAGSPRLSAREAWEKTEKDPGTKEGKVLAACFSALGAGIMEKRRAAIAQAEGELKILLKEAEEKAARDCKLYRSMGLCGGAALALILM